MKNDRFLRATILASVAAVLSGGIARGAFVNGDFVAVRLKDAQTSAGGDVAKQIILDDYRLVAGTYTLFSSTAVHSTAAELASDPNSVVTLSSDSTQHEGALHLSSDGNYLLLGGYRATAGTAGTYGATSSAVNRVVMRVDSNFGIDASTVLTGAYDKASITGAASTNGTDIWTSGGNTGQYPSAATGGLQYVGYATTTPTNVSKTTIYPNSTAATVPQPDDLRNVVINNNQVYVLSGSNGSFPNNAVVNGVTLKGRGLYATSPALPKSGTVSDNAVITANNGNSAVDDKTVPKSQAVFLDLFKADGTAGSDGVADTIYSNGGKQDLEKFSYNFTSNKWVAQYTNTAFFGGGSGFDVFGLDGEVVNGVARLFATTNNLIYTFTDTTTSGPTSFSALQTINTLSTNTLTMNDQYRGLAVLAVPEPASLALVALSGIAVLRRRRF